MSSSQNLHPTAAAMYRFIIRFKRMYGGDSPSRREIAAGVGVPTLSMVQHHLEALEAAGLIRRPKRGKARMIAIPGAEWRFDEIRNYELGIRNEEREENKCALCGVEGVGAAERREKG